MRDERKKSVEEERLIEKWNRKKRERMNVAARKEPQRREEQREKEKTGEMVVW